jgi:hypothetical protein
MVDTMPLDGSYFIGADFMTQAILYFMLVRSGYAILMVPLVGMDLLYYGPVGLGGPAAALIGGLIL